MAEESTVFDLYQPKEKREELGPTWWDTVKEEVIYPAGRGIVAGGKMMAETAAWQEGGDWLQKDVKEAEKKLLTDIPKPKTPFGRGTERFLKLGTEMTSAGGPLAGWQKLGMQTLAATVPAQLLEELGAPEWVQSLAELAGVLGPDVFAKNIQGGSRLIKQAATNQYTTQKEMIDAARRMGMTEKEIAPLAREGWFKNLLEKTTTRRGKIEQALEAPKRAVQVRNFERLAEYPSAKIIPSPEKSESIIKGLEKSYSKLSSGAQEAISKDYQKFLNSEKTGADAMEFWGKINDYFKDYSKLQSLKEPLKKALPPTLQKDFEIANTLSQRYREISKRLKPNVATDVFSGGFKVLEAGGLVGALISGNLPYAKAIAGIGLTKAGAQKLSALMLTNPRFVNLTQKLVSSLNAENPQAIMKTWSTLTSMVAQEAPDVAKEMRKLSKEEIEEFYREKN